MKRHLIFLTLISGLSILLFVACGPNKIIGLIAKTPRLTYDQSQLEGLNKYQKDAVYLIETIRQAYPRLESKIPQETFEAESKQLISDLSQINNDQDFGIRLQAFIAILKDGHTRVYIDYSSPMGKYPISLFKEKDNWIVANINQTMDSTLIGSQVISINNISFNEIVLRSRKLESGENEYHTDRLFLHNLRFPSYWKALSISKSDDNRLDFLVSKNGTEKSFTLHPEQNAKSYYHPTKQSPYSFTTRQNNGFYCRTDKDANYAYLQMNTNLDYLAVKEEIGSYTNFISRPLALALIKKQLKDSQNFGVTLQSLFKEINEKRIDNLIIDLRYNTGGDERLGKQLLWYLQEEDTIKGFITHVQVSDFFRQTVKQDYKKYNASYKANKGTDIPYREVNLNKEIVNESYFADITRKNSYFLLDTSIPKFKGKVYVLIGNMTFSAAQVLATTIADNRLGVVIGQPSGSKPSTQTGFSVFKLPNTKKLVSLSWIYMERPDSSKNDENTLTPNIELIPTFQDVIDGKDICFDYIISII